MSPKPETIYLNHAATSWPKVPTVRTAVTAALDEPPGTDPRPACRAALGARFHAPSPDHVILTPGATFGLNLLIEGLVPPGSHAVSTMAEHNSVLRPLLRRRDEAGVAVTLVEADAEGRVNGSAVAAAVTADTAAVVVALATNVTGTILDLDPVVEVCRRRGIPLVVDGAQAAGHLDIDIQARGIDVLVVAGHKALGGPAGTGAIIFGSEPSCRALIVGGTGIRSQPLTHPCELPLRYEAGTPNHPGIAGLTAALNEPEANVTALFERLWEGLRQIDKVHLYGGPPTGRTPVQSFSIPGIRPADIGYILAECHGIICRTGLHCAPLIHHCLGSMQDGTVRFSLGRGNTADHVDAAVAAIAEIAAGAP